MLLVTEQAGHAHPYLCEQGHGHGVFVLNPTLPAGHAELLGGGAHTALRVIRLMFCGAVGAFSVKIVL